jgi:hypothetical protein
MRPSLSEQLDNFVIQQEVGDLVRQTKEEFRELDREIAALRAQLVTAEVQITGLNVALDLALMGEKRAENLLRHVAALFIVTIIFVVAILALTEKARPSQTGTLVPTITETGNVK